MLYSSSWSFFAQRSYILQFLGLHMFRSDFIFLFLIILTTSSQAISLDGDPTVGKKKSETCLGCHAVTGYFNVYPSYKVPKIGGQNEEYIVSALKAYKIGDRKHGTMQANAHRLSEQDMYDIAAYLASVK